MWAAPGVWRAWKWNRFADKMTVARPAGPPRAGDPRVAACLHLCVVAMTDVPEKSLRQIVRDCGQYAEDAFLFVRDGLNFAVQRVHGEETHAHRAIAHFLAAHDLDWHDLIVKYHSGDLDESVMEVIEAAGGVDKLNRHVGGRELCWGLRDYALERWGMLARVVLDSWGVRATSDFGEIVFEFIEHDLMQQQDGDTKADFEDVYNFAEAFDDAFRSALGTAGDTKPRPTTDDDDAPEG